MRYYFLLFTILVSCSGYGQERIFHKILNEFRSNYSNGSLENFYEIAPLLDVDAEIYDPLGYHSHYSKVSMVASRLIRENTLFKDVDLDSITSSRERFEEFLDSNRSSLYYLPIVDIYLNRDIGEYDVAYRLKDKTESAKPPVSFFSEQELDTISLKRDDFDKEVDFFGALLKKTNRYDNSKKLLKIANHLIATKDPKALLYLSSELYRHRYKYDITNYNADFFFELVSAYVNNTIEVKDKGGDFSYLVTEDDYSNIKSKHYFLYWQQHYQDYVWDDGMGLFVNQKEKIQELSPLELYIKDLYSDDSKKARSSFKKLVQSDLQLVNEYIQSHRFDYYGTNKVNDTLPTFLKKRIKALTQLTNFYKETQVEYDLSSKLSNLLYQLKEEKTYKGKIRIENEMINTLSYNEITQLEYWLSLEKHSLANRGGVNNSLSRVFDYYYSNNLNQIIKDESLLRIYFKKAMVYDRYGIIGSQNNYLLKFQKLPKDQRNSLFKLLETEKDEDIIRSISIILDLKKTAKGFISKPASNFRHIKSENKDSLDLTMNLVNDYLSSTYRKYRYFLFKEGRMFEVGGNLFLTHEEIFELHELYGDSITHKNLYNYFVANLSKKDSLTTLDFNRVYGYKEHIYYENVPVGSLSKIKRGADVTSIRFKKLPQTYFDSLITYLNDKNDLVSYLNFFGEDIDPLKALEVCSRFFKYTKDDEGFYRHLINNSEFTFWLSQNKDFLSKDEERNILRLLEKGLRKNKDDSYDYEDFLEASFFFENRNLTLADKIAAANTTKYLPIKWDVVRLIFMRSKKEDFASVLEQFINTASLFKRHSKRGIVNDDLGVPLTSYDPKTIQSVINDYQTKGRKLFFSDLVRDIYPYAFKGEKLDYGEVYKILSFDNVLSFISGQGDDRNDGVKTLIRLLEEEFETDLGFQYNLRNLDLIHITSLDNRRNAWKHFLKEKGLVPRNIEYFSLSDED